LEITRQFDSRYNSPRSELGYLSETYDDIEGSIATIGSSLKERDADEVS